VDELDGAEGTSGATKAYGFGVIHCYESAKKKDVLCTITDVHSIEQSGAKELRLIEGGKRSAIVCDSDCHRCNILNITTILTILTIHYTHHTLYPPYSPYTTLTIHDIHTLGKRTTIVCDSEKVALHVWVVFNRLRNPHLTLRGDAIAGEWCGAARWVYAITHLCNY
jgi:hypothetical protein